MKQTQLYYALMLFFLMLCSCEDDIPLFPEENEFMSLLTKSSITLDENILQIQATVQKVDSAIPFSIGLRSCMVIHYGSMLFQWGKKTRGISLSLSRYIRIIRKDHQYYLVFRFGRRYSSLQNNHPR